MKLEDLALTLGKKKVSIEINEDGVKIIAKTEDLTMHELQYMSAVSFIYLGSKLYDDNYKVEEILSKGHKMYTAYHTMMKKKKLNGPDVGN